MDWEIRNGTIEDASSINGLVKMWIKERVFHNRLVTVEGYIEFAFTKRSVGFGLFVCQIDNEVVGYIDSEVGKWGVGFVLGIYVEPEHRRKGIAKQLIEKTLDRFVVHKCHKARLEVLADNYGAIKFYSTMKFVQEGYLKNDEDKRDVILMSRFLEAV